MAVTKRLRFEIFRRDNHACRYCGGTAPDVVLTVDHVVAVALGGSDDPSNLVTACRDCNSGKSATPAGAPLVADVSNDAIRWAQAMQLAQHNAQISRDKQIEVEKAVWATLEQYAAYMPGDWYTSIERFLKSGLNPSEIVEAADIADSARHITWASKWRFFCGVCWKKIERRQEEARALLDADGHEAAGGGEHDTETAWDEGWADGWDRGYDSGYARCDRDNRYALSIYEFHSALSDGRMVAEMGL